MNISFVYFILRLSAPSCRVVGGRFETDQLLELLCSALSCLVSGPAAAAEHSSAHERTAGSSCTVADRVLPSA